MGCYVDGGVSQNGSICGPPYYMDTNQTVLLDCRCESQTVPQLGQNVLVVGGSFNAGRALSEHVDAALGMPTPPSPGVNVPFRKITGIPATLTGRPFAGGTASFADGEKIGITVDGTKRTVTLLQQISRRPRWRTSSTPRLQT